MSASSTKSVRVLGYGDQDPAGVGAGDGMDARAGVETVVAATPGRC